MRTLGCRALHFLAALASCGILPPAQAEPPAAKDPSPAVRLDGDGQPLPTGAKYRLGTRDWRHDGTGYSINYSPDGKRLAFISQFMKLVVMDATTGKTLFSGRPTLKDGTRIDNPRAVAFSPGGRELAVRAGGRSLEIFSAGTLTHLRSLRIDLPEFHVADQPVVYSSDGRFLGVVGDNEYKVIDAMTGAVIIEERPRTAILGLAFDHDNTRLFVASSKPQVKVWDLSKREIVKRWSEGEGNQATWGPAVTPDGTKVALGSRKVLVVDLKSDKVLHRLRGDDPQDVFLKFAITPDGKFVVAAAEKGPVYVWSLEDGTRKWKLTSDSSIMRGMTLKPDGKQVATSDAKNRIWIWSLQTGDLLFNDRPGHDTEIRSVAFTPDGHTLVTGSRGGVTHLWGVRTGKHLRNLQTSSNWLAITADGQRLLTSSSEGLHTWSLSTGEQGSEWTTPEQRINTFRLSANQSHVAVLLHVQRPPGYRIVRLKFPSLEPDGEANNQSPTYLRACLALFPDGSLAAVGAATGAELWDLATGKLAARFPYPVPYATALEFSRDGRFLFAANSDTTVTIWEIARGQLARVLSGHARVPDALAISPGGRVIASAGTYSGTRLPGEVHHIRFWDIATGQQVSTLSGHKEDVGSLAFSPDGKLLAAGMQDTTALVWEVPEAARIAGFEQQPLTETEAVMLWEELASPSAEQGQKAVVRLAQDTKTTLALAEKKLQPIVVPPAKEIQALIQELEADEFEKREAATTKLAAFGNAIAGQLKEAAEKSEVAEIRLRCNELLDKAGKRFEQSGPMLQQTRAVQLLEWIGTPDAVALVKKLAGGAKEAHQTTEAAAALARVEK